MTSYSIYAVSAGFFQVVVSMTVWFYILYGKQDHIDTSQLSFIFKVENFCDVEDIPVVFWLFVSVTKHFKLYNFVCTAAGVMTVVYACQQVCHFSLHGEWLFLILVETSFVHQDYSHFYAVDSQEQHSCVVCLLVGCSFRVLLCVWSVPQLHCQWSSNPPFLRRGLAVNGTRESLIMDAVYTLQELLEGLTYQESLLGI